jgi:hypothetical protein
MDVRVELLDGPGLRLPHRPAPRTWDPAWLSPRAQGHFGGREPSNADWLDRAPGCEPQVVL